MTFKCNGDAEMWVEIPSNETFGYFIKYCTKNHGYAFYVSNMKRIWEYILSADELSSLIQKQNPLLVCDKDAISLIRYALDLFFNGLLEKKINTNIVFSSCQDGQSGLLLETKVCGAQYPLRLNLDFRPANFEMLFEHVTLPLIRNLRQLQTGEKYLKELIQKKDLEISEYKADGGLLSLKHLQTKIFEEKDYDRQLKPAQEMFFEASSLASIISAFQQPEENTKEITNSHHSSKSLETTSTIVKSEIVPSMTGPIKMEENELNTLSELNHCRIKVEPVPAKIKRKAPKRPLNF